MKLCMVVASSDDTRKSLHGIVKELGFPCVEVDSRQSAFIACQALMPDIIITDDENSDMKGDEFIRKLKGGKSGSGPAIIFCSADESDGDSSYMHTPFDRDTLAGRFRKMGLMNDNVGKEEILQ